MGRQRHTRRQFLAGSAASLGALTGCFPDVGGRWAQVTDACRDDGAAPGSPEAVVAEVFRADAVHLDAQSGRATIDEAVVKAMLEQLLGALVAAPVPWKVLLPDWTPQTRIGLKVNALNEQCPTSLAMTRALIATLREQLGVEPQRIVVWDRRVDELARSGFTEEALGVTVLGTQRSVSDTSGPGYGDPVCGLVAGKAPRLSRILTDLTDVTINCPVLKTHAICGVTAAMKNIYGVIDNPGDYHRNIVIALPALYALPQVRRHFRFTVVDALIAVTTGGTSSPSDTVPKRLFASSDPLAVDSRALALVERLREEKALGLPTLDRASLGWLDEAEAAGLGSRTYRLTEL